MYVGNGYVVEVVYAKERPVPGGGGHGGYFPLRKEVTQALLGRFNDRKIQILSMEGGFMLFHPITSVL